MSHLSPSLHTFGVPELFDSAGTPTRLRGKPLAIVIYLTLHPQREFNRQDIGRIIWGSKVDRSALRSVYEACNRINKRLPGLLSSNQTRLSLGTPVRSDAQDLIQAN